VSKNAKVVFEKHAVYHKWYNLVENILNGDKAGTCSFEKLPTEISNSGEAYEKLKAL